MNTDATRPRHEAISIDLEGEMKKLAIAALILSAAAFCFGQAPKPALYTPNSDLYVGYVATSPDYGLHIYSYQFNGGELAYTKSLGTHWALVASGMGSFGTRFDVKQFSGTVGPKYNFLTGPFRPYATVQAGYAYLRSTDMYTMDHHPPLPATATSTEDGFTYRMGMGADLQVSPKAYWRLIQVDIQPQPWARHTPWYVNIGTGVGYHF